VVAAGETEIGLVTSPVLQVYEVAPAAVKVAVPPGQIEVELTVVTGIGLTVTVATAVLEQLPVVPVTVYEVVVAGVTEIELVIAPVLQAYEVAPEAVKVAVAPAQMVGEFTIGAAVGLTVTVATAEDVQPNEVPVTVYEVVAAGETEIGLVTSPVLQVYEVAPAPVKVAVPPGQMVGEFTVVMGDGLTVTVATAVEVQPNEVPVTV
jgi:hypothetical protein